MWLVKGTDGSHGELNGASSANRYCGVAHDEHMRVEDACVYAESMAADACGADGGAISNNIGLQQVRISALVEGWRSLYSASAQLVLHIARTCTPHRIGLYSTSLSGRGHRKTGSDRGNCLG
jgi:hypothetical protein